MILEAGESKANPSPAPASFGNCMAEGTLWCSGAYKVASAFRRSYFCDNFLLDESTKGWIHSPGQSLTTLSHPEDSSCQLCCSGDKVLTHGLLGNIWTVARLPSGESQMELGSLPFSGVRLSCCVPSAFAFPNSEWHWSQSSILRNTSFKGNMDSWVERTKALGSLKALAFPPCLSPWLSPCQALWFSLAPGSM